MLWMKFKRCGPLWGNALKVLKRFVRSLFTSRTIPIPNSGWGNAPCAGRGLARTSSARALAWLVVGMHVYVHSAFQDHYMHMSYHARRKSVSQVLFRRGVI